MPKVREYQRQVSPAALPASRFTGAADAESFGAGRARDIGNLGKGLQSLGEGTSKALAVYQAKSQDRRDKAVVRDNLNSAESDLRILEGDLRKPENRQQALDAYGVAQKQVNDLRKRYAEQLKNPRQRDLFTASFDSQMNGVLDRAFALQEKTRLDFEKITLDAQNQSAVQNAVTNRTDPEAIKNSELTVVANTRYTNRGLPKEAVDAAVAAGRHNLHASILSALTLDSPVAAQGYLKENWDSFDKTARESLKAELDEKAFDWTVRQDAARLVDSGLNEEQILAEIDKVKDPKKADALRARIKDRFEDRKLARELQEKENIYGAWQDVLQGGDIPYGRVAGQEAKAMELYKRAELVGFAQDSDRALLMQLGTLTDQELKQVDEVSMAGFGQRLSRDDFTAIFKRYRDLRRDKGVGLEPSKLQQIRSDSTLVKDALSAMGIDPTLKKRGFFGEKTKKTEDKAADQAVINTVMREFEREINDSARAKGRELFPEEKQELLDTVLLRGKTRNIFGQIKEQQLLFETPEGDLEKNFDIRDIPLNLQNQMQAAFAARGIPVTDDNVKTYWLEYLKSKKK